MVRGSCSCRIAFRDVGHLSSSCSEILRAAGAGTEDTCPPATPSSSVLVRGNQSRIVFANAHARECSLFLSDRGLLTTTCAVNFPTDTRTQAERAAALFEPGQTTRRAVRVVGPQGQIEFTNAHGQTCTMTFTSDHALETTCPWAWATDVPRAAGC